MKTLHVDIKDVLGTVSQDEINKLDANAASALDKVLNGTGAGSDFLGWVNLRRKPPTHFLTTSWPQPNRSAATVIQW